MWQAILRALTDALGRAQSAECIAREVYKVAHRTSRIHRPARLAARFAISGLILLGLGFLVFTVCIDDIFWHLNVLQYLIQHFWM